VAILTFSGGEPLVREDLYEAVKRANDSGMVCTIASNGVLMTRAAAEKLAKVGIRRVEIGLDGATAETHDFLRNRPGSFQATLEGIRNCAALGFDEIATTMTLHSKNVNQLGETMTLAEKLGATRFYLNRLIPAGRGVEAYYLDSTPQQKIEALEVLYSKFYDSIMAGSGMQCYARGMTYYARGKRGSLRIRKDVPGQIRSRSLEDREKTRDRVWRMLRWPHLRGADRSWRLAPVRSCPNRTGQPARTRSRRNMDSQ
jgi:MoaA/NifB/PqqE/SkfB family radical SAM enzyme